MIIIVSRDPPRIRASQCRTYDLQVSEAAGQKTAHQLTIMGFSPDLGIPVTIPIIPIQMYLEDPGLLNFTSSWDFVIFREYWISRSRCNIWCSVRTQGLHEKT